VSRNSWTEFGVEVARTPIRMPMDRWARSTTRIRESYEKRIDMDKTERLTEEVRARAGTLPACGCWDDWGAGANMIKAQSCQLD
jgi:hypothetical protein